MKVFFRKNRGRQLDSFPLFLKSFKSIQPLSNLDIIDKCKELNISNFKGVFMRDELNGSISKNECLILNMDDSKGDDIGRVCILKTTSVIILIAMDLILR